MNITAMMVENGRYEQQDLYSANHCGIIEVILYNRPGYSGFFGRRRNTFCQSFDQEHLTGTVVELRPNCDMAMYYSYNTKDWPNLHSFTFADGIARVEIHSSGLPREHWEKISYYPSLSIREMPISYCDSWLLEVIMETSESVS